MFIFILLFTSFIGLFAFITKVLYHRKRIGKYPKFALIWKNLMDTLFVRNNLTYRIDLIYRAYPNEKLVWFYELLSSHLLIKDPELIGEIFVKNFDNFCDKIPESSHKNRILQNLTNMSGNKWKYMRTKLIPTFYPSKLKTMYASIDHCAQILSSHIREHARTYQPIDAKEIMIRFTMDVIGCCVFGLEFNALKDPDSEFRKIGKLFLDPSPENTFRRIISFLDTVGYFKKLFNFQDFSPKLEHFFFNLLRNSKEFPKTESMMKKDFIQFMLDIKNEELTDEDKDVIFTEEVIASNIFLFFVAGFMTTSSVLSFCLYELALNPEIQERIRNEIEHVRNSHNEVLNSDVLTKLVYMEMVISETLRKYPPIPLARRICTRSYQIPGTDMVFPLNTHVAAPVYSIHHDKRYYENPEKFDPERFTEENRARRIPYTYIPFGTGPRICIAVRFAKMEMKCCLAELLRKYKFTPYDKTDIPVVIYKARSLYSPEGPILLAVQEI